MGIIAALIITIFGHSGTPAQEPYGDVSPRERQILLEFFAATGGERWTQHDKWGSPGSACDWYGVLCDFTDNRRPSVASLHLPSNNLEGEIPPSVADLPHLQLLDVSRNRLSGSVPEPLLQRWDNYQFEFSGEGNAFANVVARVVVESSMSGSCAPSTKMCTFGSNLMRSVAEPYSRVSAAPTRLPREQRTASSAREPPSTL